MTSQGPGSWHVYLLQCGDGTYYCGITTDPEARLQAHREGKGAKYVRGRGPLTRVHLESGLSHSQALVREREIKRMSRLQKQRLAGG